MRQRVGLAQAPANHTDPRALDEPTDGLDPVGRRAPGEALGRLRPTREEMIFLNSHMLSEVKSALPRAAWRFWRPAR